MKRNIMEASEAASHIALADRYLDCKICYDIWQRFANPESTHTVYFGSFEDITSSKCSVHAPLAKAFAEWCLSLDLETDIRESNDIGIRKGDRDSSVTLATHILKSGPYWRGHYWNILLAHRESVPGHPGTGRILNSDWVDVNIVNKWKHECLVSHDSKCRNPMKIWPTRPAWLIDVENRCVVPSSGNNSDFVALSYRWGNTSDLLRDTNIMGKLREHNALRTSEVAKLLPPIIQHAMHITYVLEERYLWVDALCIDHGDRKAAAEQIDLMGAIYASAIVTIIAADSDSQNGLLGLEGVSDSRNMTQQIFPFGDEKLMLRNSGIYDMERGGSYHERGWTYQEFKMSQRRIIFKYKEMHWQCQCSAWHEELTLGAEFDKYIDSRLGIIMAGFPDLGALNSILTEYNQRFLTYEEDALPGISGLLAVAGRAFPGGFLYGLAEMFFDRALGWRPEHSNVNLTRRTASNRPNSIRASPSALPSWSWVGWHGLAWNGHDEAIRINPGATNIEETIPITEWFTSGSPTDPPSRRRRIRSTWFENRDAFKDLTRPMPTGWTRHKVLDQSTDDETVLYPDGCGQYIFQHSSMPEEDLKSWYYPFPVADIQESTPLFNQEQTAYLFCETKRAQLWAHQPGNSNPSLRNKLGTNVGLLHLHNEQQRQLFPETATKNARGKLVELVAIYKSRGYWKTWNEEQWHWTLPMRVREVYVVLWVGEKDGVSYRLASGQVSKDDWEELDLENVSLILG